MLATSSSGDERRPNVRRSRWAAIGAAVAVSLGAGGFFVVNAAPGSSSTIITIDPVRILDSRDPTNVGLAGPFSSKVPLDLLVTGSIPTTTGTKIVVPDGATGVLLNVTVVLPTAAGFVSIRPADSPGAPTTSNLNFTAGAIVPNAVTVQLPTAGPDKGKIEITYDAFGFLGPTTDILVDVVGYLQKAPTGASGVVPPGETIIGAFFDRTYAETPGKSIRYQVPLPARTPVPLTTATTGFGPTALPAIPDAQEDPACTGSYFAPTAPPGKLCLYPADATGFAVNSAEVVPLQPFPTDGVVLRGTTLANTDIEWDLSWAYTAPLAPARPDDGDSGDPDN